MQLLGVRRRAQAEIEELIGRVSYYFHHTLLTDSQIASQIAEDDGISASSSQVKVI
jgi:predicted PilT family ATPase